MDKGGPSRTAREVALFRAAHQLLDQPRVFDDPLALRIMGRETEMGLRANPSSVRSGASIRAFIAVRSRYAEDQLAQAVARGVRQYVVLGAGLDTFAYRNPHGAVGLRVLEVDHPATQTWKRQQLRENGIEIPDWLSFAPVDLAIKSLVDGLREASIRTDRPVFLSMLGLVIFMPERTTMDILNFIASLPQGSGIVFDYGMLDRYLDDSQRAVRETGARRAAAVGEPFLTFFDPLKLDADLQNMGFRHIDDCGFAEINRRYFENRRDGLRVSPGGRRLIGARS